MKTKKNLELSINERQCIAIVSFQRFCNKYNIHHPSIDSFVEHVWKIAQLKNNFDEWSNEFTELDITGQGDPYSEDLLNVIPGNLLNEFNKITQCVYETSASCWYGGESDESSKMLIGIFEILNAHGVTIPDVDFFRSNLKKSKDGWICDISAEMLEKWKSAV